MWIGAASRKFPGSSGLHYDGHDNLNVLIRGEKKWRIYRLVVGENDDGTVTTCLMSPLLVIFVCESVLCGIVLVGVGLRDMYVYSLICSPKDATKMDYAIPPHKVEANGFIHARTDSLQSMYAHFGIEPRFSKAVTTGHGVNPELHPQLQVGSTLFSVFFDFAVACCC